jgi:hypothetical protein
MPAEVLSKVVLSQDVSDAASASPSLVSPDNPLSALARFTAPSVNAITGSAASLKYLLSESVQKEDGAGPVVSLNEFCGKLLVVTLDITNVVERTGLTVALWGSPDQVAWGANPLLTFRQRQYCGVYSVLLNLATHTDVRHLRVQWSMNRWGKTERTPLFGFEVFVQESGARVSSAALA